MRLKKDDRHFLIKKVQETVVDNYASLNGKALLTTLANNVYARLKKAYPQADMDVLAKYNCAHLCSEVYKWDRGKVALKLPKPLMLRDSECLTEEELKEARRVQTAMEEANKALQKPYIDLIQSSTKWEHLFEVWPAAKKWMPANADVCLVPLNKETKLFIKRDAAKREWGE